MAPHNAGRVMVWQITRSSAPSHGRGDRLAWCGWPQGEATLTDCMLLKKATPEQRIKLLREIARSGHDPRGQYARDRLEAEGDNEPDPDPGEHPSGEMYAARAA